MINQLMMIYEEMMFFCTFLIACFAQKPSIKNITLRKASLKNRINFEIFDLYAGAVRMLMHIN